MLNVRRFLRYQPRIPNAKDDDSWRSVKLLGSRLGTAEDLNARMSAANSAFSTISWKRHSLQSRLTMFQCLIIPILLYNCGLWTLTKALSDKLDIWHRKKLKFLHNIRHPHHISNFALYKLNGSRSLSSIYKERRLLWFGHAARQGPSSPTHQALLLAIDVSCLLHISRSDAPIVPRCCRLGQCEWSPDTESAVGASSGGHREVIGQY